MCLSHYVLAHAVAPASLKQTLNFRLLPVNIVIPPPNVRHLLSCTLSCLSFESSPSACGVSERSDKWSSRPRKRCWLKGGAPEVTPESFKELHNHGNTCYIAVAARLWIAANLPFQFVMPVKDSWSACLQPDIKFWNYILHWCHSTNLWTGKQDDAGKLCIPSCALPCQRRKALRRCKPLVLTASTSS